jgi:hypothetical protein
MYVSHLMNMKRNVRCKIATTNSETVLQLSRLICLIKKNNTAEMRTAQSMKYLGILNLAAHDHRPNIIRFKLNILNL